MAEFLSTVGWLLLSVLVYVIGLALCYAAAWIIAGLLRRPELIERLANVIGLVFGILTLAAVLTWVKV